MAGVNVGAIEATLGAEVDKGGFKEFDAYIAKADASEATATLNVDVDRRGFADADRSLTTIEKKVSDLGGGIGRFNRNFRFFQNAWGVIKWPVFISGAGLATQAITALAGGVVALTGALTPLTGLLVGLPSLYGALGQAAGVVALSGMKDLTAAMGGNEEALKRLTPEAKKFMEALKNFAPQYEKLKKSVQAPLFEGLERGLTSAMRSFEPFRAGMEETAEALGGLAIRAGDLVGSKGFGRDLGHIMKTNARFLQDLGQAALSAFSGLRHVLVAAQPLTRWMGRLAKEFGNWLNESAKAGRESGALAQFFERTRKVTERLGHTLGQLGEAMFDIFEAATPLGNKMWKSIDRLATRFSDWTDSAKGRNALKEFFEDIEAPLEEMGKLFGDIIRAIVRIGTMPGLAPLIKQVRTDLLPVVEDLVEAVVEDLAPPLVDLATNLGRVLEIIIGSSGPMEGFIKAISWLADKIADLAEQSPLFATLLSTIIGFGSVLSTLGFASFISRLAGLRRGWELLTGAIEASTAASTVASGGTMVGAGGGKGKGVRAPTTIAQAPFGAPLPGKGGRISGLFGKVGKFAKGAAPKLLKGGLVGSALGIGGSLAGGMIGGEAGSALGAAGTGAGIGATIGSVVPGVGTALGAGIGAAAGLAFNFREPIIKALTTAFDAAKKFVSKGVSDVGKFFAKLPGLVGREMAKIPGKLLDAIRGIPRLLGRFVGFFIGLPFRVGEALVKLNIKIGNLLGKLPGIVGRLGLKAVRKLVDVFREWVPKIIRFWRDLPAKIVNALAKLPGFLRGEGGDAIKKFLAGAKNAAKDVYEWVKGIPQKLGNLIMQGAEALFNAGKDMAGEFLEGLKSELPGPMQDALDFGGGAVGWATDKIGGGDYYGGMVEGYAFGGRVRQRRRAKKAGHPDDTVPAMLTPGEFVLPKKAVDRIGPASLFALRRGEGFAKGGMVPGGGVGGRAFGDEGKEATKKTKKMRTEVEKEWSELDKKHDKHTKAMRDRSKNRFSDMAEQGRKKTKNLADGVKSGMKSLDSALFKGLDYIGDATRQALQAFNVKPVDYSVPAPPDFASGGRLRGAGRQDTIPLMLGMAAPGEAILNSPQQAEVEAALGTMSALGLGRFGSLDELFSAGMTHFASGGRIGPIDIQGPQPFETPAQRMVNRTRREANKYIEAHGGIGKVVAEADRMDALHRPYVLGGGHGATADPNGPWDCSGAVSQLLAATVDPGFTPRVSGAMTNLYLPGRDPEGLTILANDGHVFAVIGVPGEGPRAWGTSTSDNPGGGLGWIDSYVWRGGFAERHVPLGGAMGQPEGPGQPPAPGFKGGGTIPFKGGKISDHSPKRPRIGGKWLKGTGSHWSVDEAFTALRQLGASRQMAKALSAKMMGESTGYVRAHGPPDGKGLLQIEEQFHPEYRNWNLYNPWENLIAAMGVYRKQGIGAWYASSGSPGSLLWDRVKPDPEPKKTKKGGQPGDAEPVVADPAETESLLSEYVPLVFPGAFSAAERGFAGAELGLEGMGTFEMAAANVQARIASRFAKVGALRTRLDLGSRKEARRQKRLAATGPKAPTGKKRRRLEGLAKKWAKKSAKMTGQIPILEQEILDITEAPGTEIAALSAEYAKNVRTGMRIGRRQMPILSTPASFAGGGRLGGGGSGGLSVGAPNVTVVLDTDHAAYVKGMRTIVEGRETEVASVVGRSRQYPSATARVARY